MNALNNLTKEQRYYLLAAIAVGVYALYVRSRRKSSAPVTVTPTNGGTGAAIEPGLDYERITNAINSALGTSQQGQEAISRLISGAVEGLSDQNSALAEGLQQAAEGTVAALQQFQEAETARFDDLKTAQATGFQGLTQQVTQMTTGFSNSLTQFRDGMTAALTQNRTDILGAITAGFAAQTTGSNALLARLQEWFTATGTKLDQGFAAQTQALQQSVNAVTAMGAKVDQLPGADMMYLLLGTQTAASCFGAGEIASLDCYNVKAPLDGLPWVDPDRYQEAGQRVAQRWGQYRRSDGSYDLIQIGRQVASARGYQGGGGQGGGNSGGGGGGQQGP